eukprot:3933541-Rhodomonas_salina.2
MIIACCADGAFSVPTLTFDRPTLVHCLPCAHALLRHRRPKCAVLGAGSDEAACGCLARLAAPSQSLRGAAAQGCVQALLSPSSKTHRFECHVKLDHQTYTSMYILVDVVYCTAMQLGTQAVRSTRRVAFKTASGETETLHQELRGGGRKGGGERGGLGGKGRGLLEQLFRPGLRPLDSKRHLPRVCAGVLFAIDHVTAMLAQDRLRHEAHSRRLICFRVACLALRSHEAELSSSLHLLHVQARQRTLVQCADV